MSNKRPFSYRLLIVIAHILFWIAVYFVPVILSHSEDSYQEMFAPKLIINHVLLLFVFYFNAYFLQTWFQKKAGIILYVLSLLLVLSLCIFGTFQLQKPPAETLPANEIRQGPPQGPQLFEGPGNPGFGPVSPNRQAPQRPGPPAFVLMLALITSISILYRLILDKMKAERELREKETENLKTELSFLRSQISPHFIFNALNSTLSLIYKKSDKAADSLVKLSGLMRYMLYESDDEKTSVVKEIEYINDYIELQTLRFGNAIKITKELENRDDHLGGEIEPMLLIPFIENAFKHGAGMIVEPEIKIKLHVQDEKLTLEVDNKFNPATNEEKDKNSGIGLVNVKRRLDLLYPNAYTLDISKKENWYKVSLKLNLQR